VHKRENTHPWAFRRPRGIISEGLGTDRGIVGDAAQVAVLEFIMLEVARAKPRPLFEHHDAEPRPRQLPRHDASRRAGSDHDEIDSLARLEFASRHECCSVQGNKGTFI
jgi:hypothetical protein